MNQPVTAPKSTRTATPTAQVEPLFVTCASKAPKKDCP
jgi:hypothetical protein